MNKLKKNLEFYQNDSTPSSDGPSDSTSNSQQAFRLIAQNQNIDSQHMNPAEIIRALYEGSINPNEIGFSFIELNRKDNADFKNSSLLSLPKGAESVATVCNSLTTEQEPTNPVTDPSTPQGEVK